MDQSKIARLFRTKWAGKEILCFKSLDSTNIKAKELAEAGYPSGTMVVAEHQTAGRGRRGRSWTSEEGTGIFMSLILRPEILPEKASMLTLICALAVSAGISQVTGQEVLIKWPYDIVMNGKKICGILTEMSLVSAKIHHIVVGIGINVSNRQFPEEISQVAGSLYTETGAYFSREKIIAAILENFERYYDFFQRTEDLSLVKNEYNGLLANKDKEVRVLDPKEPFEGKALGITEKGELIVDTTKGRRMVSGGEVSVRGIYGYV